jgi:hypothetical protein
MISEPALTASSNSSAHQNKSQSSQQRNACHHAFIGKWNDDKSNIEVVDCSTSFSFHPDGSKLTCSKRVLTAVICPCSAIRQQNATVGKPCGPTQVKHSIYRFPARSTDMHRARKTKFGPHVKTKLEKARRTQRVKCHNTI